LDAHLGFWTGAQLILGGVVLCAALGVRSIRNRQLRAHKRFMLGAALLILTFLVAYVFKLSLLGREDFSSWTQAQVWVLRVHELCVAAMLLGGGYAGWKALRFRASLPKGALLPPEGDPVRGRVLHRRAGWVAVTASALGFATALFVLAGMYSRAG
jgi:uncharacterized membrane protein YozB (DUF420 family)